MEYWDLFDKERNLLNHKGIRGEKLEDGEYHIVINAWIKNKKGEYLISQRAANKSHPLMWECTGGSALKGESSIEAAVREIKEELGIDIEKEKGKLIGSTLRYYKNCPDRLDVYLFESDVDLKKVVYQKEELCNVKYATSEEIHQLIKENKFEANAFCERIIGKQECVYYIGFNANNAICNEGFFEGSISLYPNREKGNIYYSKTALEDTKSEKFMEEYKNYIERTCKEILKEKKNAVFICFNDKIKKLCDQIKDVPFVEGNDSEVLKKLNDKFASREQVKNVVKILPYLFEKGKDLNYQDLKKKLSTTKFVVQGKTGAGGSSTYLITNEKDLELIEDKEATYSISAYYKHLPLNATIIIGEYDTLILPMSVQLIALTDHRYKYVGGDFKGYKSLDSHIQEELLKYNQEIAKIVKEMGYRGILGIDYILTEDGTIYFMEINPRFQASSFLLSKELEKYCSTNIAELHYLALTKKKIGTIYMEDMDQSFLNCNDTQLFENLKHDSIIENGYFKDNKTSYYRKIYNESIVKNSIFENLE